MLLSVAALHSQNLSVVRWGPLSSHQMAEAAPNRHPFIIISFIIILFIYASQDVVYECERKVGKMHLNTTYQIYYIHTQ
jgi:hypothetical protein